MYFMRPLIERLFYINSYYYEHMQQGAKPESLISMVLMIQILWHIICYKKINVLY